MTLLLKNSLGKKDFLMTASVLSLGTVLLKVLISGAVIAGHQMGTIGGEVIAAVLVPTLGSYTYKRTALAKAGVEVKP